MKSLVFNEDCMAGMARYPDKHFDLAVVDPPYGIGESSSNNKSRSKLASAKDYGSKDWDDNAPEKEYFLELKRVSRNQIIWGANHFIESIPSANSSCWVIWNKENGENDFADCELAYCSFKSAVRKVDLRWHGMLQHDMKNKEMRIHPTQKPVALYDWIFKNYAKPGQLILDTHLGSGSSRIAADRAGLDFVGFELDKDYFEASEKRFKQYKSQLLMF